MIAVTCRNGEHFMLDPDTIERVEEREDTWVILEDGTKYVIGQSLEELIRIATQHRAAAISARRMVSGPTPAPDHVPGRGTESVAAALPGPARD
jgi:uncharacterized protein YlzI (FlbEa/FlbD family)